MVMDVNVAMRIIKAFIVEHQKARQRVLMYHASMSDEQQLGVRQAVISKVPEKDGS